MYQNFDIEREKAEQRGDEWQFGGASISSIYEIPFALRTQFLPIGEVQRGAQDTEDCASRGPINFVAAEFTYGYQTRIMTPANRQWLEDNGYVQNGKVDFSDRFIAISSGTTINGNSMKAPVDAIRKYGLIPKPLLPLLPTMTFAQYIDPTAITQRMRDLAAEFAQRFTINYEQVPAGQFATALAASCLDVAVHAWPEPINGEYPRTPDPINHVVLMYKLPAYYIYDNYQDVQGSYTKKLASDYLFFDWGYRLYVSSEQVPAPKTDPFSRALGWIAQIGWWWRGGKIGEIPPMPTDLTPPPVPLPETLAERLGEAAAGMLGHDASPKNLAPQELSCAEGCSNIIHSVLPNFPGEILGTPELYAQLAKSPHFVQVHTPEKGCVVISPTVVCNGQTVHGHCGIYLDGDKIASNDSATGLYKQNYTRAEWIAYFGNERGLTGYLFKPV